MRDNRRKEQAGKYVKGKITSKILGIILYCIYTMWGKSIFFFRQKATACAGPQSEVATIMIIGIHNLLIIVEFL